MDTSGIKEPSKSRNMPHSLLMAFTRFQNQNSWSVSSDEARCPSMIFPSERVGLGESKQVLSSSRFSKRTHWKGFPSLRNKWWGDVTFAASGSSGMKIANRICSFSSWKVLAARSKMLRRICRRSSFLEVPEKTKPIN